MPSQNNYHYAALGLLTVLAFTVHHIVTCTHLVMPEQVKLMVGPSSHPPFCFRILIPIIYRILEQHFTPIMTEVLVEFAFSCGMYCVILAYFKPQLGTKLAHMASIGWMIFATLLYGLDPTHYGENYFVIYDTPALFFLTLCLIKLRQQQFRQLWLFFVLATLTRESSFLFISCVLCSQLPTSKKMRLSGLLLLSYVTIRMLFYLFNPHLPLQPIELINVLFNVPHYINNLTLILERHYWLNLLAQMGYLPILWLLLIDYIPKGWKKLPYFFSAYALALLMVGRFQEGRIFEEILLMMYIPVVLAGVRYIQSQPLTNLSLAR